MAPTGAAFRIAAPASGRPALEGILTAALGVAAATAAVAVLSGAAPVVSLGVLYVLPVLLVATRSGVALGVAAAVGSILAYNWFLLPPIHRFTVADNRHWAALAVLLVVAVVAARIAEAGRREAQRARSAQREAALIADLSRIVLGGGRVADTLPEAAGRLREDLGAGVEILLGASSAADAASPGGGPSIPLGDERAPVGRLRIFRPLAAGADAGLRERIGPALGALLRAGIERERLAAEAVDAETLRRSDEVKTTLLRTVSHDLRTPLTQIGTAAAAIRSPSLLPDERLDLAVGIEEGTARLTGLIEKLLDLSRLEAGAAPPRAEVFPLDDLVRDALDAVAAPADAVTVEVESPPPTVRADPTHVVRIVANLVENALLHGRAGAAGDGGGSVLIRVARRRGRAVVRIVDRGPGIPADEREAIFAPFSRGGSAGGAGSGLGLAIARGFAEANGGSLRVESYPGQGAAFVLELPPAEDDGAVGETVAVAEQDRGSGAGQPGVAGTPESGDVDVEREAGR